MRIAGYTQDAGLPSPNKIVTGELLPPEKVVGSHFGIGSIHLSVRLVIDASVSMRAASRVCHLLDEILARIIHHGAFSAAGKSQDIGIFFVLLVGEKSAHTAPFPPRGFGRFGE